MNIWKRGVIPTVNHPPRYDADQSNIRSFHWFQSDSQENYQVKGNPEFSETCITYDINTSGYRTKEFAQIDHAAFKIMVCGCSTTFGVGLPATMRYGERLAELIQQKHELDVEIINLGIGGRSIDFVVRTIYQSLTALRPDYVFCLFPEMSRREYISSDWEGTLIPSYFGPWTKPEEGIFVSPMMDLANDEWDFFSFAKNLAFLNLILKDHRWAWDTWSYYVRKKIIEWPDYLDGSHCRHQNFANQGKARDNMHPGEKYHRDIAADLMNDDDLNASILAYLSLSHDPDGTVGPK